MADERPSMQMDDHPDHSMPAPEHNGTELGWGPSQELPLSMNPDAPGNVMLSDRARSQKAVNDYRKIPNDRKFPGS